jgi:hypothetical protein
MKIFISFFQKLIFFFSFFSFSLYAQGFIPGSFGIETASGEILYFKIQESRYSANLKQWTYYLIENRFFTSDTLKPVLFARDTNEDQKPDVWFFRTDSGLIDHRDQESRHNHGWDVAHGILRQQNSVTQRWLISLALNSIYSSLTFSGSFINGLHANLLNEEIEIRTLEAQLQRIRRANNHDPLIPVLEAIVANAYSDLVLKLQTSEMRNLFASLLADGGITLFTMGSGRLLVRLQGYVSSRLSTIPIVVSATEALRLYATAINNRMAPYLRAPVRDLALRLQGNIAMRLTPIQQASQAIIGVISRSRLAKSVGSAFHYSSRQISHLGRSARAQLPYVALSQSLQVAAEVLSRGEEVYNSNPIILSRNLVSNEEFVQNFAFMTTQTLGMSTLATYFQTTRSRLIACAVFSLVNSTSLNYVMKGNLDPVRTTFDTGWETIIGNAQVNLDLAVIRKMHEMGQRSGNGHLRLLGYAFAVVDQGVGYYSYSQASTRIENLSATLASQPAQQAVQVRVVPIFGEGDFRRGN